MADEKAKADAFKLEGNELYKKRNFDGAKAKYEAAWTAHKDVTYLNNLAAAEYESGEYDKAIETCNKAIDEGRDMRADYTLIAKALARIGTAYVKKNDLDNAIKYFQKSLTEHRTKETLAKLKEAEKAKEENDRKAYVNPELADKAREEGNTAFKAGDFAASVKHYTEAIKRNPADARCYNNRAAAYTKLLALPEALKDAEAAIKADANFTKAYIRKSNILFAMKEYSKALTAAQDAAQHDPDHKSTREIADLVRKINAADAQDRAGETDEQAYARAMRDPEIQQIMSDPAFQSILMQAQQDPSSLAQHMTNPQVRDKVEKLVRAGIIKTR